MSEPVEAWESQEQFRGSRPGKGRVRLGRAGRWVRGRSARWIAVGAAVVVIGGGAAATAIHHEAEGHGDERRTAADDQAHDGRGAHGRPAATSALHSSV
ncbi:hypothetical protein ABZW30_32275 [Kitasatospora sp. NPDC004669]|uniref:hypothetical protein n=1 Tax=Kitasatospora sp. NPDC004669 TaxID=3154555 RepID=UPI0033BBC640